jgi:hypothetical protein
MRANYGKPLRAWFGDKKVEEIIDFGDLPVFADATTYPMIMKMQKSDEVGTFRSVELDTLDFTDLKSYVEKHHKVTDQTRLSAKGWTLSDIKVQKLLEKLESRGVPLGEYVNGEIYRGVLTGLNDAFVIDEVTRERLIAQDPKSAEVIKPFLAGRDIKRYETPVAHSYLILFPKGWTHKQSGITDENEAWAWLKINYKSIFEWLEPFMEKGKKRYDKGEFWWELRTCDYYDAFEKPKVMLPDISTRGNFCFDTNHNYCANTAYIIPYPDFDLLGVLNSKLITFYYANISSEIRGGYLRFIYQYLVQLPIIDNRCEEFKKTITLMIDLHYQLNTKQQTFLNRLQDNLDLDKPSKKLEAFYEHDFKTFLKELKKKKITLSLTAQDEWEAYFNDYKTELMTLQTQIDTTDKEIDKMVYELYGLTEEEIAVVEGR